MPPQKSGEIRRSRRLSEQKQRGLQVDKGIHSTLTIYVY
jgi:hypothetical protein